MSLKMSLGILAAYLGTFVASVSAASDDASKYKIGTWGNFAQGAISHTFDDNMNMDPTKPEQTAFNDKKFHITLFVITGQSPNWKNCQGSFAKGHEIGSHSVSHGNPSPSSEYSPSQKAIQQNVPGEKCVTYAYPNCSNPGGATKVFIAARTCESSTPNSKSPSDWGNIQSKGFGSPHYSNDANSMNSYANAAASSNGWGVGLHHGIGNQSHSWATTNLNEMKTHLDYLDKNRNKIWMETFGNVARYIQERDKAKITAKATTDNSFTITVDAAGLDTSIFNYPLCIRREMPSGWTTPKVTQNGKEVKDTIITDGSKKFIQFDAVPNGGDVVLSSGSTSSYEKYYGFSALETAPVKRVNATLIIDPNRFNGANVNVVLFNLQGRERIRYRFTSSKSNIIIPLEKFNHSALIVKVAGGSKSYMRTCLPQP